MYNRGGYPRILDQETALGIIRSELVDKEQRRAA